MGILLAVWTTCLVEGAKSLLTVPSAANELYQDAQDCTGRL